MEHHAWPSAPFHQLGQAHELLMNAMQEKESSLLEHAEQVNSSCGKEGYLQFHFRFLRNLFGGASI
jgi:fatty acid desaturase